VALDASVLINFLRVERLDLLGALPGFAFTLPDQVAQEITYPEQTRALNEALETGLLRVESSTDPGEIANYAELRRVMGRGEAACLAMAETRGWDIAADEGGRFRRLAEERLGGGRILNTAGILVLAIRAGLLSVEEADEIKARLEECRFRMAFASFRDVLDP
jgi:predicted nucleic acid-binding protein